MLCHWQNQMLSSKHEWLSLSEKEQMESRLYVFPAKSYVQEDRWDFFSTIWTKQIKRVMRHARKKKGKEKKQLLEK